MYFELLWRGTVMRNLKIITHMRMKNESTPSVRSAALFY